MSRGTQINTARRAKRPPLYLSVKDIKNKRGIIQRAQENQGSAAWTADPKYSPLGQDQFAAPVVKLAIPLLDEAQDHLDGSNTVSVVPSARATSAVAKAGTTHQLCSDMVIARCFVARRAFSLLEANRRLKSGDSAMEVRATTVSGGLVPTRNIGNVTKNKA